MKNKLLLSGLALLALSASAQQLKNGDILWPDSQLLYQYVKNWTPGQHLKVTSATNPTPSTASNAVDFDDEEFFISRVKLKDYFRNVDTQVYADKNEDNDKFLVNWVPMNEADGTHTDALPNARFDSEVFSNWSYVTMWGDWISPHGWVPGALADAAHKHGVLVHGVASIPYGSLGSAWSNALVGFGSLTAAEREKLAQFLHYHGSDGLGYNSEFSSNATVITNVQNTHKAVSDWMEQRGYRYENMWYDGTNDNGGIQFDSGLSSHNDGNFKTSSLFMNYNWTNLLSSVQNAAPNYGKSSLYMYAGHNMQGGQPGSNNWNRLAQYNISIGLWGAHNTNMLWSSRSVNGSSPLVMQDSYQKRNEQWFTNAKRNPVYRMQPYSRAKFSPDENWFGMSVYMTARSSLSWDLTTEPFISYFNLGNGRFLNWKGERLSDIEWYNIGVQDYMPTWRWWFTKTFLAKDQAQIAENGLDAQFVWNEAWMGGSCLNIFGSTEKEYLHLFKTKFEIEQGDVITVRYKLMGGSANAKLVMATEDEISSEIEYPLFTTEDEPDDEWIAKTFTVAGRGDALNGNTLAVIALEFDQADDMQLYLGEISIVRGQTPTPEAPEITKAVVLRNNISGADAKVIFKMANDKPADEPCYNLDVNTSLFKLYAQVDGQEHFMGLTSSWAGLMFRIPVGDASTIKLGVQAVSTDFETESAITWSNDIPVGSYDISNEVVLSQNVIKPNEPFTVGYLDQKHAPADWEITNANTGAVVKSASGVTVVEFNDGIAEVAPYNVKVTEGSSSRTFNWMIQITDEGTGAMPQIHTLSINDGDQEVEIEEGETLNVAYTGRNADGGTTRALSAAEAWVGGKMGETGLEKNAPFTVAAWVKYTFIDEGGSSCFFSIEDRTTAWPQNNWGWFWSNLNGDGTIGSFTFRTSNAGGSTEVKYTYENSTKIPLDTWTHVAIVFNIQSTTQTICQLYINGIKQNAQFVGHNSGNQDAAFRRNSAWPWNDGDWFSFFGGRGSTSVPADGLIDDLQLWDKALTAEEVEIAMNLTRDEASNYPNLKCYWDFELDDEYDFESHTFSSLGSNKSAPASQFNLVAADAEGQAVQTPQVPDYKAGNPFLTGSAYKVVTKPTWSGRRAIITENDGTGASGSAKVTYKKAGEYTLTLTLENDYGKDVKDYPLVTVNEPTDGLEVVGTDSELKTYTANDALYVLFGDAGNYEVSVYNVVGSVVAQRAENVTAGKTMRIALGKKGVYVVRIAKEGKAVKAFKILSK